MDLKTFADKDFDSKKWINKAWSSSGDQEKEVFVANTVSRLQLYMKQLTNSLDEATTQIVTSLPRVMQDASLLHEEAKLLEQKLQSLEQKVQGVEEQTGHSIESLQRIDKLKSKLETAAQTLHEADKWAAMTSSLENMLETGIPTSKEKLTELSTQVASMTQSLELMTEASDYDSKRVQLETLYNRLEAAISPPLFDAIIEMDPALTQTYASVYRGMGRSGAVCRCWRRSASARLAANWRALDAHTVPALTAMMNADAGVQVDWLINVLKSDSPLPELIRLYTDMLLSLDPSPTKIASANLKLCNTVNDGLSQLINLKKELDMFAKTIRNVIELPQFKEKLSTQIELEFGRAAYASLRQLLPKCSEMLSQMLKQKLDSTGHLDQAELLEQSRKIVKVVEQCDDWLSKAYTVSVKIGGVAAYPHYMTAVENFMTLLSSVISSHSHTIEREFSKSVSEGRCAGVLSDTFAASLILETATVTLIDTVLKRHEAETSEPMQKDLPLLEDMVLLLLDEEGRDKLSAYRDHTPDSLDNLRRLKETLGNLAKNILKQPVEMQLETIPQLPVWSNNDPLTTDLPDFAVSPQEYITEVGQYLMTLPQHLEMHLPEKQAPWQFLSEVCVHTCEIYAEKILNIRNMDELGTKRCLTDIVYLSNVVEDLGVSITPALKSLEKSLRVATPPAQDTDRN